MQVVQAVFFDWSPLNLAESQIPIKLARDYYFSYAWTLDLYTVANTLAVSTFRIEIKKGFRGDHSKRHPVEKEKNS